MINGDFETGDLTGWDFTPDPLSDPGMSPQVAIFDGSNAFRVNAGKTFFSGTAAGGVLSQNVALMALEVPILALHQL